MLLTLLAVYAFSSVHAQIGSSGQDCTPGVDDNRPSLCVQKDQLLLATENKIECKENYDCCLCGTIECSPDCKSFKANGDYAAYGVPKIIIDGSEAKGADVDCDGDSSCELAVITATNVNGIKCGGDNSCETSTITAECASVPCKVECDGDHACKRANFHITNVEGISCGHSSCVDSVINIVGTVDGFKLECGAEESCKDATINIVVNGDEVTELKSIDCGAYESCLGAAITITNIGSQTVTISEIKCEAMWSCLYTQFKVVGDVQVDKCRCAEGACAGATFDGFPCNEP